MRQGGMFQIVNLPTRLQGAWSAATVGRRIALQARLSDLRSLSGPDL